MAGKGQGGSTERYRKGAEPLENQRMVFLYDVREKILTCGKNVLSYGNNIPIYCANKLSCIKIQCCANKICINLLNDWISFPEDKTFSTTY